MELTIDNVDKYYKFVEYGGKHKEDLIIGVMFPEKVEAETYGKPVNVIRTKIYYGYIGCGTEKNANMWNNFYSIFVKTEYYYLNDEFPRDFNYSLKEAKYPSDFNNCVEISKADYNEISTMFKNELSNNGALRNITNKIVDIKQLKHIKK